MRIATLAFAGAVVLVAAPAMAGTVITSEMTVSPSHSGKSVAYVETDRLRIEGPQGIVIFRGDQNTVYQLQPGKKTYVRLTPERMTQLAARVTAARSQLSKQLNSLPPEQRAKAEAMLAMTDPGAPAKFEFRKTGGAATYGKWHCDRLDEVVNGQAMAQLCVARLSEIGLSADDVGAFRRFQAFMQQGMPLAAGAAAAVDPQALEKVAGYPAYPVHTEVPQTGAQTTTLSVEKKDLAGKLFELPAGYREEAIPAPPH